MKPRFPTHFLLLAAALWTTSAACALPALSAPPTPSEDEIQTAISVLTSLTALADTTVQPADATSSPSQFSTPVAASESEGDPKCDIAADTAEGEEPDSRIVASAGDDFFWVNGFLPGSTLELSVFETVGRQNELWRGTEPDYAEGIFNVNSEDLRLDLKAGNMIVVSDGQIEKSLVLEHVAITTFDINADFMAGTAPPCRLVRIVAANGPSSDQQHTVQFVSDPETGVWRVDLASMGVNLDEAWRPWSFAQVFDDDGDANEATPVNLR